MGSQESQSLTDIYYSVTQCHRVCSDGKGNGAEIIWSLRAIFEPEWAMDQRPLRKSSHDISAGIKKRVQCCRLKGYSLKASTDD
jgi:hypothetical protein